METREKADRVFGKANRVYLMGIAIIWIVFFHVYLWCDMAGVNTPRWIRLFDKGALGVDLFLLLSAYGLQGSIRKNNIGRFYLNRIKRLFPVYFLFLLTLFLTYESSCPITHMIVQSVFQITGLSLFKYPEFFSCEFCFDWFTPAIITLYIFFPLISKIVEWIIEKGLVYEIAVLVLLIFAGVWIRENKHFPFGLFALRFPIIYLGCVSFIHIKNQKEHHLLILCIIAACIALLSGNEEMRLSLLLPPLLISFSFTQFTLPLEKYINMVGRHSYEVYLAHIFPVAFFIPMHIVTNVFLLLLITVFSTIIIASIFAYLQKKFYIWL